MCSRCKAVISETRAPELKWGNLTRPQLGDFEVAAGASNVSGGIDREVEEIRDAVNDQSFLLPPECVLEVVMILERLSSLTATMSYPTNSIHKAGHAGLERAKSITIVFVLLGQQPMVEMASRAGVTTPRRWRMSGEMSGCQPNTSGSSARWLHLQRIRLAAEPDRCSPSGALSLERCQRASKG